MDFLDVPAKARRYRLDSVDDSSVGSDNAKDSSYSASKDTHNLINTSKDFLFISRKDAEQNYKSLFKAELRNNQKKGKQTKKRKQHSPEERLNEILENKERNEKYEKIKKKYNDDEKRIVNEYKSKNKTVGSEDTNVEFKIIIHDKNDDLLKNRRKQRIQTNPQRREDDEGVNYFIKYVNILTSSMEYNNYKLILTILILTLICCEISILSIDLYSYMTSFCIEFTESSQFQQSQIGYAGIIPSK